MSRIARPLLVILLGAALRVGMVGQNVRFHPDEALYASFAREVSLHGDFLLTDTPLDKPPLALFVMAGSFRIFGATEFAARLPSLFASILTLATVYTFTRRLYNEHTAALAGLLLALSPLDLAFAATAFVDPLLTLFVLLSCLAASQDRWRTAGLFLGLAIATKQSALEFAPLVMGLGLISNVTSRWRWRDGRRRLLELAIPIGVVGLALFGWSTARAAPTDFWALGAYNNNPGRFIRADEVLSRLSRWLDLLSNLTGFWPVLILAVIPYFSIKRHCDHLADLCLGSFALTWFFAYWLIAFNIYDRYLHTLGPLVLILVARGVQIVRQYVIAARVSTRQLP